MFIIFNFRSVHSFPTWSNGVMEMQKNPFHVPNQTEPIWMAVIDEIRRHFNPHVMVITDLFYHFNTAFPLN